MFQIVSVQPRAASHVNKNHYYSFSKLQNLISRKFVEIVFSLPFPFLTRTFRIPNAVIMVVNPEEILIREPLKGVDWELPAAIG